MSSQCGLNRTSLYKVGLNVTSAQVIIRNGKQANKVFQLSKHEKKIIGRETNCNIQVLDKGASRNHSLIEFKGDHFLLVDLGSTNGTFVNDKTIISKILADGDIIKIGQTELLYRVVEPETETKVAPSSVGMIDEFLPANSIVEKIDVTNSLCGVSLQDLQRQTGSASSNANTAANYLSTIYELSNLINKEQTQLKMFDAILDKIMDVFKPDRAYIVIYKKEEENPYHVAVERDTIGDQRKISKTILSKTILDGVSVRSGNAAMDGDLAGGMSIVVQKIKSVMCVPLESQSKVLGAIYIDSVASTNRFTKSDLDLLTAVGVLAGVAIERAILSESAVEKEKLHQAMEIAQNIQRSMLPDCVPDSFEYDLVGWNKTCDETGGDYYDFFELPNNRLAITVGDVTGHGIGAALLMATARAFLKALAMKADSVTNLINELNFLLEKDMDDDKFMTLFYGEFDAKTMQLTYSNAGHDNPLLYRVANKQFEELEATGMPLGIDDEEEYEEESVKINKGDVLIMSTDGITEAMNPEGEQFGQERFEQIIKNNVQKSANQIIRECYNAVTNFCQGAAQRDDLTLVVIKFNSRIK